jgi:hypothetical protein
LEGWDIAKQERGEFESEKEVGYGEEAGGWSI